MMRNTNLAKEQRKLLGLPPPPPPPIGLGCKNFFVEQSFNKGLKFLELLKDFRFIFEQIDQSKLAKVINKTDIIFVSSYRITSWTPQTSEKTSSKGDLETLSDLG
jgi:hypothetical protein